MRFDYRNEYKDMSLEDLREHLKYQQEKIATYNHVDSIREDCVKRISYIAGRISKLEKSSFKQ